VPSKFRFTQDQFGEILGKKAGLNNSIKLQEDYNSYLINKYINSKIKKSLYRACEDDDDDD
jgi:hypothetical protein